MQDFRDYFSIQDKVVLIAGGAGGIGSTAAQAFASFGAVTVIWDYNHKKAEELSDRIKTEIPDSKVHAAPLNASVVEDIWKSLNEITREHGRADILVNCVGTHIECSAEDITEKDWDTVLEINLKTAFFMSQAVARHQISAGIPGRHIHVTSVRSKLGIHRGYSAYCASKGGMNMMIKQLATEWAKHNIKVNGIAPTFTRTALVAQYLEDPGFVKALLDRIPAGRICEPEDLAGIALFLSMPASDYLTGQILFADGGLTAAQ